MPIYEYKGQQYDLSTSDPAEAKGKIQKYLGEGTAPKEKEFKPVGSVVSALGRAGKYAGEEIGGGYREMREAMQTPKEERGFLDLVGPRYALGALRMIGAPATGVARAFVRDPILQAPKFPGQETLAGTAEFAASIPLGLGEAKILRAGGKLATSGISAISDMARSARLGYKPAETLISGEAKLLEKGGAGALEREQARLTAEQNTIRNRIAAAETASADIARAPETALRQMPGVRTVEEAGRYRPVPMTAGQVGNYARDKATQYATTIRKARNEAANKNMQAAIDRAEEMQNSGYFINKNPLIRDIDNAIERGGSADYLRTLQGLKNDLQNTKDFRGVEVIRRKLGDAAFGAPEEGYAAIGQNYARDAYRTLTDQMKAYFSRPGDAGVFSRYLNDYERLSEKLRVYGTKVGQGLTKTASPTGEFVVKSGEQISKDIFSSAKNYKEFVAAVGNDRQVAEAAARRYFAGKLEGLNTPEKVEMLIKNNRELLREMPSVQKQIEQQYLTPLRQAAKQQQKLGSILDGLKNQDAAISKKLAKIPGSETVVSDAVRALSAAKRGDAMRAFDEAILPKIRSLEQQSGTEILSEQSLSRLRRNLSEADQISDSVARARRIAYVVGGILVGERVISKTTQIFGI